jgi:2'-5' RNA ligase
MGTDTSVSIWLVPDGEPALRLHGLIAAGARALGTERFAPHLTLQGGVEGGLPRVLDVLTALAAVTPPLDVTLTAVSHSAERFRAVVLEAEASRPLLVLQQALRAALRPDDARPFRPHVSLVYGELPEEARARFAETVAEWPRVFRAQAVVGWRTAGPAPGWTPLLQVPLRGLPAASVPEHDASSGGRGGRPW